MNLSLYRLSDSKNKSCTSVQDDVNAEPEAGSRAIRNKGDQPDHPLLAPPARARTAALQRERPLQIYRLDL